MSTLHLFAEGDPAMTKPTDRISLNLPRSLKKAAEDFAVKDGVSVNHYIALALAEKIGALRAEEFFAEPGKGGDAERAVAFLEGRAG